MEALISAHSGLALVLDSASVATIHADDPDQLVPRARCELPFLLDHARDFVAVERVSRQQIVEQLVRTRRREEALDTVLVVLDAALPDPIRLTAASEADDLLEDDEVAEHVERLLYTQPLPEDGDLAGALFLARQARFESLIAFLVRLDQRQPAIREVRNAWNAVPAHLFAEHSDHWQAAVVREGLFRDLVLTRAEGARANTLFVQAATAPAIRGLPNHRAVLQAWITPFLREASRDQRFERAELQGAVSWVREPQASYGEPKAARTRSPRDPNKD